MYRLKFEEEWFMKRWLIFSLIVVVFMSVGILSPRTSDAGIGVSIGIPLPGLRLAAPPDLAIIAGTPVYFAPDIQADLYFYHGNWYRPYGGEWYVSAEFGGPWGHVAIGNVPPPLVDLPPDYRSEIIGYEPVPYAVVKRNWMRWEQEGYWDNCQRRSAHSMSPRGHGMGMGMGM